MTMDERMEKLMDEIFRAIGPGFSVMTDAPPIIKAHILAAIEEEREACADIAEKAIGCTRREIALMIRARANPL